MASFLGNSTELAGWLQGLFKIPVTTGGEIPTSDTLSIRLPIDFAILYQITQSTSSTESYSEGFTLIARILYKIVSNAV